jgi:hypothetical protein
MKSEATIRHRSPYRIITCIVEALRPTITLSPMRTWSFARLQKRHNLSTSSTASRTIDRLRIWLRLPPYNFAQLRFPSHTSHRPTKPQKLQPQIALSPRTIPPHVVTLRQSSRNLLPLHTEKCESYRRRCAQHIDSFQPSHRFSRCLVSHHSSFCITNHLCSLRNGRTTSQRYAVLEPPGIHRPATIQSASA